MTRIYGDVVAHSAKLAAAPSFATRSLREAQIGLSRLSIGSDQLGMTQPIPREDTFIAAIYLTDLPDHELWSGGRAVLAQGYRRNALRIVNLVDGFSAFLKSPHETLVFYIPKAALIDLAQDIGCPASLNLACEPGVIDPVIAHFAGALTAACASPEEATPFFMDHAILACAAHLVKRYGGVPTPAVSAQARLSPAQTHRAKEFMAVHCAGDLSVADVAEECRLSRAYFIEAFKTTTGATPHQWLQRYRVDKAKTMMRQSSSPLAEIAIACGFVDQSHLTRLFKRFVGQSPGLWRRGLRH